MQNLPNDSVQITVENNTYTIKLPNTGQLIDIEVLKNRISKGQYLNLISGTNDAIYSSAIVDAISSFSVLIPDLEKDINYKNILELPLIKMKSILDQYINVYKPWYNEWMNVITSPVDDNDSEE